MGALARSLPVMVVGLLLFTILISAAFSNEMEEEEEQQMLDPRQVRFSFGLGKRSSPPLRPDVAKLLATMKAWGYASPHGLFKRGKDLAEDYQNEEIMQLLEEVGEKLRQIGQKSKRISEDEMGKRHAYGFGLGKRDFDPEAPPMVLMKRETKRRAPQS